MTKLVAKEVLVVPDAAREPERPEHTSAVRQKIPDAPSDQHSYEVIVERPPRVVASRYSMDDETHRVVDEERRDCKRLTVSIASHRDRHFRPIDQRSGIAQPGTQVRLGHPAVLTTQCVAGIVDCALRVGRHFALDTGGRRPSEVGSQRLPTVSSQVIGMGLRQEQHASA
jgi:hypothetical protein